MLVKRRCSNEEVQELEKRQGSKVVVNILGETYNVPRVAYIASENFDPGIHHFCYMVIDTTFSARSFFLEEACFNQDFRLDLFTYPLGNFPSDGIELSAFHVFILEKASGFLLSSSTLFLGGSVGGVARSPISVDLLVFSKDRPSELENLLASIDRFLSGMRNIHVIYRATSPCFVNGYNQLQTVHQNVRFVRETESEDKSRESYKFMDAVLDFFETGPTHVVPIVSEVMFIRPVNLQKLALELEKFNPLSSVQLRLGTHLSIYSHALSKYKDKFIPPTINKIHGLQNLQIFDTTVGEIVECLTEQRKFHNAFWYVTNTDGALYSSKVLYDQWKSLAEFKHPGDLEFLWYHRKYRFHRHHLMPMEAYCISNDGYERTRPDHVKEDGGAANIVTVERRCKQYLSNRSKFITLNYDYALLPLTVANLSERPQNQTVLTHNEADSFFKLVQNTSFVL